MNKEGHIGLVKNTYTGISDQPSEFAKEKIEKMKQEAESKKAKQQEVKDREEKDRL